MISINYMFIIVILNFVLLLIILNKLLYKPIKQFLLERQKKIANDIDQAKASREEAGQLVQQKEEELKTSAEEVRKMKNAARRDAENQASEIFKSAKTLEKKILKDTESQLVHEKDKVMKEIEGEIAGLVTNLSAKFLAGKIDDKNDQELIEKMLSEREDESK
ncbi:MAG: F0F1 ATP synthase subunit B [Candidatus Cloacimonadales bacterium]|nr:F0F1 ATP synthase subunit B [Candidatus Cloacimonadales bacterium]